MREEHALGFSSKVIISGLGGELWARQEGRNIEKRIDRKNILCFIRATSLQ